MACGGVDYFYQRCGQNMVMTRRGAVGVMLGECGWGREQSYLGEAQDAGLASGGAGGFSQRSGLSWVGPCMAGEGGGGLSGFQGG